MDDRTDKINVEDRIDVDDVKQNGEDKKASSTKSCHFEVAEGVTTVRRDVGIQVCCVHNCCD